MIINYGPDSDGDDETKSVEEEYTKIEQPPSNNSNSFFFNYNTPAPNGENTIPPSIFEAKQTNSIQAQQNKPIPPFLKNPLPASNGKTNVGYEKHYEIEKLKNSRVNGKINEELAFLEEIDSLKKQNSITANSLQMEIQKRDLQLKKHKEDFEAKEKAFEENQRELNEQKKQNTYLNEQIINLNQQSLSLNQQNMTLSQQNQSLIGQNASFKEEFNHLQVEMTSLKEEYQQLKSIQQSQQESNLRSELKRSEIQSKVKEMNEKQKNYREQLASQTEFNLIQKHIRSTKQPQYQDNKVFNLVASTMVASTMVSKKIILPQSIFDSLQAFFEIEIQASPQIKLNQDSQSVENIIQQNLNVFEISNPFQQSVSYLINNEKVNGANYQQNQMCEEEQPFLKVTKNKLAQYAQQQYLLQQQLQQQPKEAANLKSPEKIQTEPLQKQAPSLFNQIEHQAPQPKQTSNQFAPNQLGKFAQQNHFEQQEQQQQPQQIQAQNQLGKFFQQNHLEKQEQQQQQQQLQHLQKQASNSFQVPEQFPKFKSANKLENFPQQIQLEQQQPPQQKQAQNQLEKLSQQNNFEQQQQLQQQQQQVPKQKQAQSQFEILNQLPQYKQIPNNLERFPLEIQLEQQQLPQQKYDQNQFGKISKQNLLEQQQQQQQQYQQPQQKYTSLNQFKNESQKIQQDKQSQFEFAPNQQRNFSPNNRFDQQPQLEETPNQVEYIPQMIEFDEQPQQQFNENPNQFKNPDPNQQIITNPVLSVDEIINQAYNWITSLFQMADSIETFIETNFGNCDQANIIKEFFMKNQIQSISVLNNDPFSFVRGFFQIYMVTQLALINKSDQIPQNVYNFFEYFKNLNLILLSDIKSFTSSPLNEEEFYTHIFMEFVNMGGELAHSQNIIEKFCERINEPLFDFTIQYIFRLVMNYGIQQFSQVPYLQNINQEVVMGPLYSLLNFQPTDQILISLASILNCQITIYENLDTEPNYSTYDPVPGLPLTPFQLQTDPIQNINMLLFQGSYHVLYSKQQSELIL